MTRALALACCAVLTAPTPLAAHDTTLGEVRFELSCTEAAAGPFTEGLKLLHHMMYVQARQRFSEAAEADPACAMAEWGKAMSYFHPVWPGGPTPAEMEGGAASATRLTTLTPGNAREAAYVAAALAFWEGADTPYPARLAAWAGAQREIDEAFPDDIDAAAFDALAQIALTPPGPGAAESLAEAGDRLAARLPEAPLHPAIFHYVIHAYDHPALATKARAFAKGYDRIAPEVPHALHMPSHIFTRLGDWEASVAWNARSGTAALAQPLDGGVVSNHYAHAVDYGLYALLQLDRVAEAEVLLAEFQAVGALEDSFGTAYALAASPARVPLEQGDWAGAAALPAELPALIGWEKFPQAVTIHWFAKGLGAARSGDTEAARAALEEISARTATLNERGMGYWVTLAEAQSGTIEAWLAWEAGEAKAALAEMRAAAELEDSVGKAPVTPGAVLPARELLGDMLLLSGDRTGAAEAYRAALAISPGRKRSVEGLAEAEGG
ncbi:hypothetical protein [Vannielia litorea]|uniref:hypothetical protein n=1 Tax=Vannielia litorea TaxID=1217970 RepID=UPI001C9525B5|nr:hypothetical protein [Vannielia litorea]MBY6048414.1 hypothetical protein [Vannielia litorea]MBY6075828.1 hypothetical protein [Vannielia litorea]